MEAITRRVFLKRAISGVGGIVLTKSLVNNMSLAQPPADMSTAVAAVETHNVNRRFNKVAMNVLPYQFPVGLRARASARISHQCIRLAECSDGIQCPFPPGHCLQSSSFC